MLPTHSPFDFLWRNASLVRSPMASRSHWLTAPMMVITRRPAAEPVSSDSVTETNATFFLSNSSSRSHRSLTLRVQPVEFGDDYASHLSALHQRQKPLKPGAVEALGRFAINDDLVQLCTLHRSHRTNLGVLRFERH